MLFTDGIYSRFEITRVILLCIDFPHKHGPYSQLFKSRQMLRGEHRLAFPECNKSTDTDKPSLTFPALPLLHDGLQPLLLLLRGLGHADEPLVLRRVVDLPAVVHDVPAAVVVS